MKVNDILNESHRLAELSNADHYKLDDLSLDKLYDFLSYLENVDRLDLPKREYIVVFHEFDFNHVTKETISDQYIDAITSELEYRIEMGEETRLRDRDYDPDDLRDYDEEDRQAAWQDKYDMYKNEY